MCMFICVYTAFIIYMPHVLYTAIMVMDMAKGMYIEAHTHTVLLALPMVTDIQDHVQRGHYSHYYGHKPKGLHSQY
jgi:hypothetical protein